MKRKAVRVKSPRKRTVSKPLLNRAINVAQERGLPISDIVLGFDGTARLVIGKPGEPKTNDLDKWIDKHATGTEGH